MSNEFQWYRNCLEYTKRQRICKSRVHKWGMVFKFIPCKFILEINIIDSLWNQWIVIFRLALWDLSSFIVFILEEIYGKLKKRQCSCKPNFPNYLAIFNFFYFSKKNGNYFIMFSYNVLCKLNKKKPVRLHTVYTVYLLNIICCACIA